jgi:hypothetical protein
LHPERQHGARAAALTAVRAWCIVATMKPSRTWFAAALLASACGWSEDLPYRKEQSLRMALTPAAGAKECVVRLDIADLEVVASDGPEASLEGVLEIRAAQEADLALTWTTPALVATDRGLELLQQAAPSGLRGRHQLQHRLKLMLPRELALQVRVTVGSARVRDRAAAVTLEVGTGEAWIDRSRGPVVVKVTTGEAMVREHQGTATARVTTGNLFLGLLRVEGALELGTTTGNVTARIPADASLQVQASTDIGSITSDVPLDLQQTITGMSGGGRTGTGAHPLTARAGVGDVRILLPR